VKQNVPEDNRLHQRTRGSWRTTWGMVIAGGFFGVAGVVLEVFARGNTPPQGVYLMSGGILAAILLALSGIFGTRSAKFQSEEMAEKKRKETQP